LNLSWPLEKYLGENRRCQPDGAGAMAAPVYRCLTQ